MYSAILESEIGELICQVAASESSFSFYAIEIIHHLFFRQVCAKLYFLFTNIFIDTWLYHIKIIIIFL